MVRLPQLLRPRHPPQLPLPPRQLSLAQKLHITNGMPRYGSYIPYIASIPCSPCSPCNSGF